MSANALFRRYSHLKISIMNYLSIVNNQNLFYLFQLLHLLNVNINNLLNVVRSDFLER